ncbi:MAG: hypothetical protein IJ899_12355, partial [Blautia sp.]|nr:hypothetical protein [Blautia sp.]
THELSQGTCPPDSFRKEYQMIGYEDYLRKYPQVARSRAERMLSEGKCLFLKENGHDLALLPRNSSSDELIAVDLNRMTCECNVFHTKKACPHVAAALGFVEKNGGQVPYTDPVSHVYARLEWLKNIRHDQYYHELSKLFLRDVAPFLKLLPKEEKKKYIFQLGCYFQDPQSNLDRDAFTTCYDYLWEYNHGIAELLFQNRHDCFHAVVELMTKSYSCPFSEKEKQIILNEIASDDALAARYLPSLAGSYSSCFSRKQLLDYYRTVDENKIAPYQITELLKRLLNEEPPLYEEYLNMFDNYPSIARYFDVGLFSVQKLVQAGYGNRLGKIADSIVSRMGGINDYFKVISLISHDQFLASWKKRKNDRNRYWTSNLAEWEIEVDFREDPEADPDDYELDELSCRILAVILETRPGYRKEINNAARKIYRRAVKERRQDEAMEALLLLARGEDAIAVKYVSEMDNSRKKGKDLVYIAAVGVKFNCLQKLAPELKRMEVSHAAGQD